MASKSSLLPRLSVMNASAPGASPCGTLQSVPSIAAAQGVAHRLFRGQTNGCAIGSAIDHDVGHAIVDQPVLQLAIEQSPGVGKFPAAIVEWS